MHEARRFSARNLTYQKPRVLKMLITGLGNSSVGKVLLVQTQNLNLIPQSPNEKLGVVAWVCNPCIGKVALRGLGGLIGQLASLM